MDHEAWRRLGYGAAPIRAVVAVVAPAGDVGCGERGGTPRGARLRRSDARKRLVLALEPCRARPEALTVLHKAASPALLGGRRLRGVGLIRCRKHLVAVGGDDSSRRRVGESGSGVSAL